MRESCVLAATRNADISFDDEKFEDNEEDLRRQMKKLLKQRDHLAVVRLEVSIAVSAEFQKVLSAHQVFVDATTPNMRYVFRLISELPKELSTRLLYPVYRPRWAEDLRQNQSILAQVQQKDRLLFYPFDSVEPFLRLLNEAAENPQVLSIKMTIYRLASSSKIAQTLCRAAENGKEVLVLMELRARFDEENNLAWSKMLEESGCQVIYGTEGFKCHSKICLITLRNRNKTTYLTQIGTGNYNEKTNAMYTDLCLMTADQMIGEDAAAFFRHMLVNKAGRGISAALRFALRHQGDAVGTNRPADCAWRKRLCLHQGELRHRARGHQTSWRMHRARAWKFSSSSAASAAFCRVCPARRKTFMSPASSGVFWSIAAFISSGGGGSAELYISSADLMTRNLNRRVEIACPVHDTQLREQLRWILESQRSDTVKASLLLPDGSYCRKHSAVPFDSQNYFMQHSPHIPAGPSKKPVKLPQLLKRLAEEVFRA